MIGFYRYSYNVHSKELDRENGLQEFEMGLNKSNFA